jgi:hypothetical protein
VTGVEDPADGFTEVAGVSGGGENSGADCGWGR